MWYLGYGSTTEKRPAILASCFGDGKASLAYLNPNGAWFPAHGVAFDPSGKAEHSWRFRK